MGRGRSRGVGKDYRMAIREMHKIQYVICPTCGLETEKKDNTDAHVCTRCGKIFTTTGLENKSKLENKTA